MKNNEPPIDWYEALIGFFTCFLFILISWIPIILLAFLIIKIFGGK